MSVLACDAIVGIDKFRACGDADCPDAGSDVSPGDGSSSDVANVVDAAITCSPNLPFGNPVALTNLNTSADEVGGYITADGQRFYFARQTNGNAGYQVFVAPVSDAGAFGLPSLVSDISNPDAASTNDFSAFESPDGLRLYFFSYRSPATPGYGGAFISNRASTNASWQAPTLFADGFNQRAGPAYPIVGALYQGYDFLLDRLPVDTGGNIGAPVSVDDGGSGINVAVDKPIMDVVVTPDELHLYFSSYRSGLYQLHIWSSDRTSTSQPWGQPTMLPMPINTEGGPSTDTPAYITPNNCTLYYASARSGSIDLYKASRNP